jgi:hypothetical protein
MAIPESQLATWAGQGAKTTSASTYATIKNALENPNATYASRDFKIFLQGSYGNDTNIHGDSDVDAVIRYDGAFFHNVHTLPASQQSAFNTAHPGEGNYPYSSFKTDVEAALKLSFGNAVKVGNKALKVKGVGSRRDADVVVAFRYRYYDHFNSQSDKNSVDGIRFVTASGESIENYPERHSDNLTTKHQATNSNFKPTVRIFKNMRSKLVADGILADGAAPSYFIEGLLSNVPNQCFTGTTWAEIVLKVLRWLNASTATNRGSFTTASGMHKLILDGHSVCWPVTNADAYIRAVCNLWDNWTS